MSQLLERAKQNAQKREDSLLKNKGHLVLLFAALAAASGPILGLLAVIFFSIFLLTSFRNRILIEEYNREELIERQGICPGAIKAWAYALDFRNAREMFLCFQNFGKKKEKEKRIEEEGSLLFSPLPLFLLSFIYFLLSPAEAHAAVGVDIDPSSILLGATTLVGGSLNNSKQQTTNDPKTKGQKSMGKNNPSDYASNWHSMSFAEKRKTLRTVFGVIYSKTPSLGILDQKFKELLNAEFSKNTLSSLNFQQVQRNLANTNAARALLFNNKTALKEGYVLNSSLTFVRRDSSTGGILSSNLNPLVEVKDWLEQKSQSSMSIIHGVSGDYNAAIYTVGKYLGLSDVDLDGSNILKVVAPQQATAEEKKFIVRTLAALDYTVFSDGFYLKNGSNVAKKFAELAVNLFGTDKDAMLQVRSYFRGAISTPAIKSLTDMPVVVVSKGDSYFDNCVAAEGTDGGAICTYHLVNGRSAFQFRYFGDAEGDNKIRFAKGLATQAKVVWCVEDQKIVGIEDVNFNKNGPFEQTIQGKTYIAGLFLNGSMFKGQHKKAISVGMRLNGILNVIAEDNNLPAYTHFGWQNNVNLNMSQEVQVAVKNIYGDLANKYLMKDNPLFNYLSLNANRINRINTNGLVRVQSTYVQTANLGGDAKASRGDEGIAYALMPTNKDGKPLSMAMMATGRQPQQQWSSHGLVKAYSPSFGIKTLEMARDVHNFDKDKDKARIEYLTTLGKRFSWLTVKNGAVTVTDTNGLNQYLFFLKCVIAPSVQQNILWVDYTLQAIVNGDNDGDKNWYSFNKDIVTLVTAMLKPNGNTMIKKATESSKKLLASSPLLNIGDWVDVINGGERTIGYYSCVTYLAASGGSPGQGNVGAITNMVGAFNAHLPFFDSKNEFAPIRHLIQLVEYVYQVQQIAIDWQKYYYYAVSLKNWHLWTPGKLSIPGYTYLVPGQKERVSDEIVKKYNLTAGDFGDVDLEGYSAHLAENYSPSTWVEVLPAFTGRTVEINDVDVMYSSTGIYLWGMWVVNCFQIAIAKNVDAKTLWSKWLENDMAEMNKIAALDPKADEFKVELNKLLELKDYNWITASELTTWTKNNAVWGENKKIAIPKQINLMLSSIRNSFQDTAEKKGIVEKDTDLLFSVREKFIEAFSTLENKEVISYQEKKVRIALGNGKEKYFLMALMSAFKASQAEALDGVTQSVKAQGQAAESASASLRLLINACGHFINDDSDGHGADLNKVRVLLGEALPLNSRFQKATKQNLLEMFKTAAIKALVSIAKKEKELEKLNNYICDFGPGTSKYNAEKHLKNLSEAAKLEEEFENKLSPLQAFLADNFIPAIDQSLENEAKGELVAKLVNDQIIENLESSLKIKSTVDSAIVSLKAIEDKVRTEFNSALASINDDLIAFRSNTPKFESTDPVDSTEYKKALSLYNSELAAFNAKLELKAKNSKEYQDGINALNYFQKVYRALKFYGNIEQAFDAIVEETRIFTDGKVEKLKTLRTSIKFDLSNAMKQELIANLIKSGTDISILGVQIQDFSSEMRDLILQKNANEITTDEIDNFVRNNPTTAVFKMKPSYLYLASKEILCLADALVGNKREEFIQNISIFFCQYGFGCIFDLSDLEFLMEKHNGVDLLGSNRALAQDVLLLSDTLKKVKVGYKEESEEKEKVVVFPWSYAVFSTWSHCELVTNLKYNVTNAIAAETGLRWHKDISDEDNNAINNFYGEVFKIKNPFFGESNYKEKLKNKAKGNGISDNASNVFVVVGEENNLSVEVKALSKSFFENVDLVYRRRNEDEAYPEITSETGLFVNEVSDAHLSFADLCYNYLQWNLSQADSQHKDGDFKFEVLFNLLGVENYLDNRIVSINENLDLNKGDNEKIAMHQAMYRKQVNAIPSGNVRQLLRNHDCFDTKEEYKFIEITKFSVSPFVIKYNTEVEGDRFIENEVKRSFLKNFIRLITGVAR